MAYKYLYDQNSTKMNNNIKNKIAELYKITPDHVTVVSFGYKIINNNKTNIECIIFGVKNKKKAADIPADELLPSEIYVDGKIIPTDVIKMPDFSANVCYNYEPIAGEPIGSGNPDNQIIPNRRKQRPIKGGLSTTNLTRNEQLSVYSAGTLGVIVVDSIDCRMVGLTNNHVYTSNSFMASDRSVEYPIENTYQNITSQPADLDGGQKDLDEIGKVKRYFPLSLDESNYIDAAITTLNSIDENSYKIHGLLEPYAYLDFATTEEIDNIINTNNAIFKAGRTTGSVGYPFSTNSGSCEIKITQINVSVTVNGYFNNGINNSVDFEDCLIFAYSDGQPGVSIPGDSGSVLIAKFGDTYKIIGLCFAGSPASNPINSTTDGIMGVANRIDKVAELLSIQPWTPDKKIRLNSEDPACYVVKSGLSSEKFIYLNGKKYYQIGTTYKNPTDLSCFSNESSNDKVCPTKTPTPTPTRTPTPTSTPTLTPTLT